METLTVVMTCEALCVLTAFLWLLRATVWIWEERHDTFAVLDKMAAITLSLGNMTLWVWLHTPWH